MWTAEHRRFAARKGLRYPSDLTDGEWALIEPMIPPAKRGGRRRKVNIREVLNAIFYVLSTGCQWQALPKDLPPKSTVHSYFMLWDWDGTLERIHHALYVETRERDGRAASPSVAIIDSQSAKAAPKRGSALDPQGFDAGKKVTGRKRHILVDTLGLLLNVVVHPANLQDRDGVRLVLDRRTRRLFPFVERIFADAGYQGPRVAQAAASTGRWVVEIVKRNELHKFVVLPKRWIVERTLAWISRNRRLARDFERYARSVAALVRLAMIRLMLRRLTRPYYSVSS
ncbi:MAG TPA: IS5 family transposase [Xanthobacteraceae bacterium]